MVKNLWKKIDKYNLAENFINPEALRSLARGLTGRPSDIFIPAEPPDSGETTVLVHGLFHRAAVMRNFAKTLAAHHQQCVCYDYPTTRTDIAGSAAGLKRFLKTLLDSAPERKINLVTHSLGGLIVRAALTAPDDPLPPERFKYIVMLAPPNHGSAAARRAAEKLPNLSKWLVKPLCDLSDAAGSAANLLPEPDRFRIGIIAGNFDKRVTIKSTKLKGQCDFIAVPCGHSFMMHNPEVQRQTVCFLAGGRFSRPAAAETEKSEQQ